ncbi:MAG: bacillithiol biosynthesis cysteine-adding enzyme BshC [Candidatus Eiseniibacteriota bacterium]
MNHTIVAALPHAALGAYHRTFVCLTEGGAPLGEWLPPLAELERVAEQRLPLVAERAGDRRVLWERLASEAGGRGAPRAVRDGLTALAAGAPAVVTGQQPGLLGGPAYTLYKLATTIALAREWAARWQRPVVPVFWVASYDTDYAEIATAGIVDRQQRLETLSLDGAHHEQHRMVGGLPADLMRSCDAALRAMWEGLPGAAAATAALDAAVAGADDWGSAFDRLVEHLLGDAGVVVIDGRHPLLRDLAVPLVGRYVEVAERFAEGVIAAGDALEGAGFRRQLGSHAATWSLRLEDGGRRWPFDAVPGATNARGRRRRSRDLALEVLAGRRPGRLWPGVALRPIVADYLLPSVAHVVGPGESAYMAQLAPAYALLDEPQPAVVPRLTATWIPAELEAVAAGAGVDAGELVAAPGQAIAAIAATLLGSDPVGTVGRLRGRVEQEFATTRNELLELGRGIDELTDAVAGRIGFQLERLAQAVGQRQRARLRRRRPAIENLIGTVAPRQGLQERRLSWLGLLAWVGPELGETVEAMAAGHVEALLGDGPVPHLVLGWAAAGTGLVDAGATGASAPEESP